MEIEMCSECGVPLQYVDNHTWTGGGTVGESNDPDHRMVLIECANMDSLFREIEKLIGIPIERIIIEAKRKATRDYLNRLIPMEVKESIHKLELDIVPLIEAVSVTGHILGYGDSSLERVEYTNSMNDYVIERIKEPYSIQLWCGDLAGSSEAVTDRDHDVSYEIVAQDEILVKAWPSERPETLTARLQPEEYPYLEGDIELDRCLTCGGPAALSGYEWFIQRGVIEMKSTRRRVAMIGSLYLNAIFDELERELGADIPKVIIEAQRRFTIQGTYSMEDVGEVEEFRRLLALRGLGNLIRMDVGEERMKVSIQNASLQLMLVGLMQGYFDILTGGKSSVDWEINDAGTLDFEVYPTR
jgi:hypothetical protein